MAFICLFTYYSDYTPSNNRKISESEGLWSEKALTTSILPTSTVKNYEIHQYSQFQKPGPPENEVEIRSTGQRCPAHCSVVIVANSFEHHHYHPNHIHFTALLLSVRGYL